MKTADLINKLFARQNVILEDVRSSIAVVAEQHTSMIERFDGIDQRLDNQAEVLAQVATDVTELRETKADKTDLEGIKERLTTLETRV